MADWEPPRCIHGHIILGCPHDDCPTQGAYLDQQEAALAEWGQRQQDTAAKVIRQALHAYVDRLAQDPEFIRQCEESERRWNRQLRGMAEGDEAVAAEFRSDLIDIDQLRREQGTDG